jgi:uncharacterized protein YigE (DUF2233 family)
MAKDVQDQVEQQEAAPTAQEAAPAAPDLNISDLAALRSIVEVASQRGAFKATELEAVGKTFNKLHAFLESVTKKEE